MFKYQFKKLLEKRKISEKELANMLDIEEAKIQEWLAGNSVPNLDEINKLNIYFELESDYFIANCNCKMKFSKEHFILILSLMFLIPAIISLMFFKDINRQINILILDAIILQWEIEQLIIWRLFLFIPGIALLITYLIIKIRKMIDFRKMEKNKKINK